MYKGQARGQMIQGKPGGANDQGNHGLHPEGQDALHNAASEVFLREITTPVVIASLTL